MLIAFFFLLLSISGYDKCQKENIFNYTINTQRTKRKLENEYRGMDIFFDITDIQNNRIIIETLQPEFKIEIDYIIDALLTINETIRNLIEIKNNNKEGFTISDEALTVLKNNNFKVDDNLNTKSIKNDLIIFMKLDYFSYENFGKCDIIQYKDNKIQKGLLQAILFIIYNMHLN